MARRGELGRGRALGLHILLWAVGFSMVLPFGWMATTSFKSEAEVFQKHILPQATTLGPDGGALTTADGRPLYTAVRARDDAGRSAERDGRPVWLPGEPLRVARGSPILDGAKGDQAKGPDGAPLYDDLGVPVLNAMVDTDADRLAAQGGAARFRDPRRFAKFAEPVLVPRGFPGPENERLARAYFSRFDATWEEMVAGRWGGRVPLMATTGLLDPWAGRAGRSEPAELDGRVLDQPGAGTPYIMKELSWERPGQPVRWTRRANHVVDARGLPIPHRPAFPILRTLDDPLFADEREVLLVRVGSPDAEPAPIRGADVATETRLRLVTGNYRTVLADPEIKMSLFAWNSFFVCCAGVALQVLTSALAAFAFARLEWKGRDAVFFCYLATLMVPGVVTAIPNYLILQQLGWLNTFYALIIPGAAGAYGTFLLRQYMLTLPKGLEEAARIDGASLLRVWWDIVLPLCRPALITLAIFTFAGSWQSFSWPLVVAPDESVRLLPVALQNFSDQQSTAYNLLMAASLLMMIPMLILFIFGQKYFVSGIQLGGVKG